MADFRSVLRHGSDAAAGLASRLAYRPRSRLFLVGERANWVTQREMIELGRLIATQGIKVGDARRAGWVRDQAVFYGSQFEFFARSPLPLGNAVGVAYYHGRPGTVGYPEFDVCWQQLRAHRSQIERVQVTHSEIRDIVLDTGIDAARVFTIPIGINLEYFSLRTDDERRAVRAELGIPQSAVVIGSFQKDGVGWGDGMEPKSIKGPDVFADVATRLRDRIPELHVLLVGPARGYLSARLDEAGVPYSRIFPNPNPGLAGFDAVGRLYGALDLYLITSRQEGGPKAVLESMASGVPLVTTRVGHAMDVVRHGENAWMVDVDDVEGLTHWAEHALANPDARAPVLRAARATAEEHAYPAQAHLWRAFCEGFVEVYPSSAALPPLSTTIGPR